MSLSTERERERLLMLYHDDIAQSYIVHTTAKANININNTK